MSLRADTVPSLRTLFAAAALAAANALLFLLIAEDVLDGGGLISRDQSVLTWFVDHRTDQLISAARFLSTIGSFVSLLVIGGVLAFWIWRRGWHWALAVAPIVALSLGGLTASVAKAVFDRPRPPEVLQASSAASAAFPSGHATDAAAFFLAAAFTIGITITRRRWEQAVLIASGALIAGLIGLSRLVLGVHWLSDVVAGWTLGSALAITVVVSIWYLTARNQPRTRIRLSRGRWHAERGRNECAT
jgi:undecaprenyl-diphosphatase